MTKGLLRIPLVAGKLCTKRINGCILFRREWLHSWFRFRSLLFRLHLLWLADTKRSQWYSYEWSIQFGGKNRNVHTIKREIVWWRAGVSDITADDDVPSSSQRKQFHYQWSIIYENWTQRERNGSKWIGQLNKFTKGRELLFMTESSRIGTNAMIVALFISFLDISLWTTDSPKQIQSILFIISIAHTILTVYHV